MDARWSPNPNLLCYAYWCEAMCVCMCACAFCDPSGRGRCRPFPSDLCSRRTRRRIPFTFPSSARSLLSFLLCSGSENSSSGDGAPLLVVVCQECISGFCFLLWSPLRRAVFIALLSTKYARRRKIWARDSNMRVHADMLQSFDGRLCFCFHSNIRGGKRQQRAEKKWWLQIDG